MREAQEVSAVGGAVLRCQGFLDLLFRCESAPPCRAQDEQHSSEVSVFREELSEAHSKLQILQKQLDEELDKQPITTQEVGSLHQWVL